MKKDEHSKREPKEILWIKDETKTEKGNNQYLYYVFNSEQQQYKNLDKETLKDLLASEMLNLYNENIWVPGLSEEKKTVRSSNIEH